MVRIKICCISSAAEAELAVHSGACALGFVSSMPSGPGVISESLIADIVTGVPTEIDTFLLTSRIESEEIISQQHRTQVNTIQLCDRLAPGVHAELRLSLPGVKLVQVIHISGDESIAEALLAAKEVDALLLDSGNQSLATKELGGTGRTHDWALSARIVADSEVPVYLAGGLNADNVTEAIQVVSPYGVDLCSGVRSGGRLDETKLHRFISNIALTK